MTILKILLAFILIFAVSLTSFYFIFNHMSPYEFGNIAITLFYSSVFLISFSSFSLFGIFIRYLFADRFLLKLFFYTSIRQSALISVVFCLSFYLMHINAFSYLNLFLLLCIGVFIEVLYLYFKNKNQYD